MQQSGDCSLCGKEFASSFLSSHCPTFFKHLSLSAPNSFQKIVPLRHRLSSEAADPVSILSVVLPNRQEAVMGLWRESIHGSVTLQNWNISNC